MKHPISNRTPPRRWPTTALFAVSGVCWILLVYNTSTRAARVALATAVITAILGCTRLIVHNSSRDAANVVGALRQFQSSNETVAEEALAETVGQFVSTGRVVEIWGGRGRHAYKGTPSGEFRTGGATVLALPVNGTGRRKTS